MGCIARIISRRALITLTLITLSYKLVAGQDLYDYRYYKLYESEPQPALTSADTLAVAEEKPRIRRFDTRLFDYNFHTVKHLRRGHSAYDEVVTLNGVRLKEVSRNAPRYLLTSYTQSSGIAISDVGSGSSTGLCEYRSEPTAEDRTSTGVAFSTRAYTAGITASTSHTLNQRWSFASKVDARTGRDLHVEGLFQNSLSLNLAAVGQLDSLQRLSFALFFAPSERATRQASTAEAFRLLGNNLYNPAWGYQGGEVRSSRVRRTLIPTAVASYERQISPKRQLLLSLGVTGGTRSQSAMEWFDSPTVQPDNYRYMPSYLTKYSTAETSAVVEEAWRRNDTRYTQIDFDNIYAINRRDSGMAHYAIVDRVTHIAQLQLHAAMLCDINPKLRLTYGVDLSYDRERNFKQMRDLLGGSHILDIDYFLLDDQTYSNARQNDLSRPNRKVKNGDRFGYDYALTSLTSMAFVTAHYNTDRLHISGSAEIGYSDVVRCGYYRKELFASNSLGRSRRVSFAPYTLRGMVRYELSEQHTLWGNASVESRRPDMANLFLQPDYNNRIIDLPKASMHLGAELGYRYNTPRFWVACTAFVRYSANECQSWSLYDDTSGEFADMVVRNIDRLNIGVEAELSWRISNHWRTSAAFCYASNTYADNPLIALYSDTDNRVIIRDTESYCYGLATSSSPQVMVAADITYRNRGWSATLAGSYAGVRYVEPSLLRRTDRVLRMAMSNSVYNEFMNLERLNDAFNIDLTLSKSFYLARSDRRLYSTKAAPRFLDRHPHARIVLIGSVRNLLGTNDNVYYGYESSRLTKRYLANESFYFPQATRYLYSYPRTYYIAVRFVF